MPESKSAHLAVYLVESAKGLVSVRELPVPADRHLVVMLGQFSCPSHGWPETVEIIGGQGPMDVMACQQVILQRCQGHRITLIFTDDTFNEMSYRIHQALKAQDPALVLFDHLRHAGITYKTHATPKAFIRFRHPFIRHPLAFRPIVFSNGVAGYKLAIRFHETSYFSGGTSRERLKVPPEKKILLLVPLHYSKAHAIYLHYVEKRLASLMEERGLRGLSHIAYKMHPRRSEKDIALLKQHATLHSCTEFDASVPLELYDLSGFTVVNLDSSVGQLNGAKVILLANHFGYTRQETSNMSGEPCLSLLEVERLLNKTASTLPISP